MTDPYRTPNAGANERPRCGRDSRYRSGRCLEWIKIKNPVMGLEGIVAKNKIAEGMAHLPRAQASLLETAKEYDRRAARATRRHKTK